MLSFFIHADLIGQDSTLDNYSGEWGEDASWFSGTSPGYFLNEDIDVYGFIRSYASLTFANGFSLLVQDTLLIYGDLTLNNDSKLTLAPGAVLIIYGNYTSKNKADVGNGGIMVVTGEWSSTGSQGSFTNDGDLYTFDPDPQISPPEAYSDVTCDTSLETCHVSHDSTELINSAIGDLFIGGGFTIEASGPTAFCPGGSVDLSTDAGMISYQWYLDGAVIGGATSNSYTATLSGDYSVEVEPSVGTIYETAAVTVDASDTEPPVISVCASGQTLSADASCQALVPDLTGSVSATDNCDASLTITQSPAAGTAIGRGVTTVTITVEDDGLNTTTCIADITVIDNVSPVAVCQDITVQLDATGNVSITAADIDNGSSDNCGIASMSLSNNAFDCSNVGTNTVILTVQDNSGNTNTCSANVTVEDASAPVPDVATLSDINAECEVTSLTAPTATDICDGTITGSHNATLPITATGTTTVTWTYTDAAGNSSSQTQDVVIADMSAPVADVATLSDINAECEVTSLTAPTATDNCDGTITGTHNATLPVTATGTTTITWTYTDAAGNSSSQTQDVVIADVSGPVADVATLSDINAECEVTSLTAPTATDNCDGTVTGTHNATLPVTATGTTTITWTYTDAAGNSSSQTQDVVIADVSAPVADVATLIDINAECEVTSLTAPTATDNCDGTVTGTHNATLPITAQGTTTVTWTYTDAAGNSSSQAQDVVITDVTPPVALCQNITVTLDGSNSATITTSDIDGGSTDNCGIASMSVDVSNFDCSDLGDNTVLLTVKDIGGNESSCSATVTVVENEAPVITNCPNDHNLTVDVADNVVVPDYTGILLISDNCSSSPTVSQSPIPGTVLHGVGLIETITIIADDGNGNTSQCIFDVTLVDTFILSVTCPGPQTVYTDANCEFVLPDLTPLAVAIGAVSLTQSPAGGTVISGHGTVLPVTFTATDGSGGTETCTIDVTLIDNNAPVADVATLSDINAECEVTSLTAPTATDNCDGTVTGTHNATLPITAQGTTIVTWTYTDAAGNSSSQTQDVVIADVSGPVADVATLSDINVECEVTSLTAPTATDNCDGTVTGTHNATLPITAQGTTTVTWTYTDAAGNSSSQTQDVVIADVSAPVADVATLSDINAECEVTSLTAPTATDNCDGAVTGTHNATLPITAKGSTMILWTYTDAAGNSSSQTQDVVIADVSAPVADVATLSDISAECEVTSLTAPTATDNCDGTVTGTHNATLPITSTGTTTITWTYTDAAGNSSSQTQDVVIADVSAPVADVAALSDINAECEVTSLTAPTATDNCDGAVTGTHNATLPITATGTTTVTWTYTDAAGNSSSQAQDVVIADVSAPFANVAPLSDINAECEVTSLTAPTATDNCDGTVTGTHNATLPITAQGPTTVTWTYTDAAGNSSSQTQDVVIADVSAPVADVATLSDINAECEVTSLTAPTATDNCDGAVTGTHNATLPITAQGTTTVTWTYTDAAGNSSSQTQDVVIADVTAPVISSCPANREEFVSASGEFVLPDYRILVNATDNCSSSLLITQNPAIGTTISGIGTVQTINLTVDDGHGNTSQCSFNVTLAGIAELSISYSGALNWYLDENCSFTIPDFSVLATVVGASSVTQDPASGTILSGHGTAQTITLEADDGLGNTKSVLFDITLLDTISPTVITRDISVQIGADGNAVVLDSDVDDGSYDNCGIATLSLTQTDFSCSELGANNLILEVTDVNGNTASSGVVVTVLDEIGPTITCPADVSITAPNGACEAVVVGIAPVSVSDNCPNPLVEYILSGATSGSGSNDASGQSFNEGITTVWYIASDASGNKDSCSFLVQVDTELLPPLTATADKDSICQEDPTITLSYEGDPGAFAEAVWYSDPALTMQVGTGNNLSLSAPSESTSYYVRFESMCDTSESKSVSITLLPTPSPGFVEMYEQVCVNGPLYPYVAEGSPGSEFTWSVVNGSIEWDLNDTVYVNWGADPLTGSLSFTETTVHGCVSQPVEISIDVSGPTLDLGDPLNLCPEASVTVIPEAGYEGYLWHDGSTDMTFTSSLAGMVSLQVWDAQGCSAEDSVEIISVDAPDVDLGPDTTVCSDDGYMLDAGEDGISYTWSTGGTGQTIVVYNEGDQQIWVEVENEYSCVGRDTINIAQCYLSHWLEVPTGISPSSPDGKNDTWVIPELNRFENATVEIYNQWGTLVWKSEPGYPTPWDGRGMNGEIVPVDSYHFIIRFNDGTDDTLIGYITVIK